MFTDVRLRLRDTLLFHDTWSYLRPWGQLVCHSENVDSTSVTEIVIYRPTSVLSSIGPDFFSSYSHELGDLYPRNDGSLALFPTVCVKFFFLVTISLSSIVIKFLGDEDGVRSPIVRRRNTYSVPSDINELLIQSNCKYEVSIKFLEPSSPRS